MKQKAIDNLPYVLNVFSIVKARASSSHFDSFEKTNSKTNFYFFKSQKRKWISSLASSSHFDSFEKTNPKTNFCFFEAQKRMWIYSFYSII